MRVRITYEKTGTVCFVPHVEMPTQFSRSLRRAGLRQVFTEGMSPHPKVSLGPPLPVGVFSLCELADFWLEQWTSSDLTSWNKCLPEGLKVTKACHTEGRSLSKLCDAAQYILQFRSMKEASAALCVLKESVEWARIAPSIENSIEVVLLRPYQASPTLFVKVLSERGVISSWKDIRIVRTKLGRFHAQVVVSLL